MKQLVFGHTLGALVFFVDYSYMLTHWKDATMYVPVRDAKIYVEELGKIVIGYETKGTTMLLSVGEVNHSNLGKDAYVCFSMTTDKWLITSPRSPAALSKKRADIYIDLSKADDLVRMCEKIDKNHPEIEVADCPGLKSSFFPNGLEEGPKKLPRGYNCFRAPIADASFDIKELNMRLKPVCAEFFIDYEINDVTHWFQFTTPALHFALRAPTWLKEQTRVEQSEWVIYIDIKCEKAIMNCIKAIRASI